MRTGAVELQREVSFIQRVRAGVGYEMFPWCRDLWNRPCCWPNCVRFGIEHQSY